jgi:nucleotide-binding universal stress UspA family protein
LAALEKMMKLLVATDGSEGGDRAIDYAAGLAKAFGGELLIVNVASAIPASLFEYFTPEQDAWLRETQAAASKEILSRARERAKQKGAGTIMLESRFGDVVQSIIDVAEEQNADVVIVGKRGAGLIKGLLVGSVSQKLVSLMKRPVIVVP